MWEFLCENIKTNGISSLGGGHWKMLRSMFAWVVSPCLCCSSGSLQSWTLNIYRVRCSIGVCQHGTMPTQWRCLSCVPSWWRVPCYIPNGRLPEVFNWAHMWFYRMNIWEISVSEARSNFFLGLPVKLCYHRMQEGAVILCCMTCWT